MSVLLLLLGIVTTAAGLALVASAATIDADIVTPGTVAAVGGLLLIGLALAVRELQRIEQALVGRPGLGAARSGEAITDDSPGEAPAHIPFPPKPKASAQTEPAAPDIAPAPSAQPSPPAEPSAAKVPSPEAPPSPAVPPAPAPAEDGAFERLRAKFPTLARLERAAVVETASEASAITQPSASAEAEVGEVKKTAAVAGGRANGGAPARITPRFDTKARLAGSPERAKSSVFNTFWPAVPRRDAPPTPPAPPAQSPTPVVPAEPVAVQDATPKAGEAAAPVSAIKSGVVEGMAYTLYSDGSIEAQLPQGKLRFGSITALRNHIERGG